MSTILSCLYFYSQLHGINPDVTKAVISVESNWNAQAISRDKQDIGLMQVRAKFVPESKQQLLDPCTNIRRGTKLLALAKKMCKHKVDKTWIVCYNLGHAGAAKIKHPKLWPYYKKVVSQL